MANFEVLRWNFSSSTNSEIGRSVTVPMPIVAPTMAMAPDVRLSKSKVKLLLTKTFPKSKLQSKKLPVFRMGAILLAYFLSFSDPVFIMI